VSSQVIPRTEGIEVAEELGETVNVLVAEGLGHLEPDVAEARCQIESACLAEAVGRRIVFK
jgi:hypothetical protein